MWKTSRHHKTKERTTGRQKNCPNMVAKNVLDRPSPNNVEVQFTENIYKDAANYEKENIRGVANDPTGSFTKETRHVTIK